MNFNTLFYADDMTIYCIITSPRESVASGRPKSY